MHPIGLATQCEQTSRSTQTPGGIGKQNCSTENYTSRPHIMLMVEFLFLATCLNLAPYRVIIGSTSCSTLRVPAQVFLTGPHVVVKGVVNEEEGGGGGNT